MTCTLRVAKATIHSFVTRLAMASSYRPVKRSRRSDAETGAMP